MNISLLQAGHLSFAYAPQRGIPPSLTCQAGLWLVTVVWNFGGTVTVTASLDACVRHSCEIQAPDASALVILSEALKCVRRVQALEVKRAAFAPCSIAALEAINRRRR
jgi:hypothetical protein